MTDLYPTPNGTIYGMDSLVTYTVSVEPLLFLGLFIAIWLIIFLATRNYGAGRGFTFASFICAVLSIPISFMGWLAPRYIYLFVVLTGIGIIWVKISDGG